MTIVCFQQKLCLYFRYRIVVTHGEHEWTVLRRYKHFRQLHAAAPAINGLLTVPNTEERTAAAAGRYMSGKWADDGIRVTAIAPGWIETERTQGLRDDPDRTAGIMARTPMKRWGKPEEVGALVQWLLSENAGFVTGAVYPVDGGYLAM